MGVIEINEGPTKGEACDLARRRGTPGPDGGAAGNNVPMDHRGTVFAGLLILTIGVGSFAGWAAFTDISSAVVAAGTLRVDSDRKTVQHDAYGVVKELMVRNGDMVVAGEILLRLDRTQAVAALATLQGRYDSASANVSRLIAEQTGAAEISFAEGLRSRRDQSGVIELIEGQLGLFEARRLSLDGKVQIVDERVGQRHKRIRGLRTQVKGKQEQIAFIEGELKGLKKLLAKGYTTRTRVLALQREAARLRGERDEQIGEIAWSNLLISEARLEVLQIKKTFQEEILSELRERRKEMADLAERVSAARRSLENMEIRAPAGGAVVELQVHTVGRVIKPGEILMGIAPQNDDLIVEARVQTTDIDGVMVGLPAEVQFTAVSQASTPRLRGRLI